MHRLIGLGLLASAFAPLVAILALISMDELGGWGWVLLACSAVAAGLLTLVLRSAARLQTRAVQTTSVRRADEHVLSFTSSYVVPIVIALFGGSSPTTVIATVALVALLAVVYVRGDLYHLNPTLSVCGFRLYEVTRDNGSVVMLLTRAAHVPQRGIVQGRFLGEDMAIELKGGC